MTTSTLDPPAYDWRQDAACRLVDPELFWPQYGADSANVPLALHICRRHCDVREQCLAWAQRDLDRGVLWPCVAGGFRWVSRAKYPGGGGSSGRAHAYSTKAKAAPDGCPLCPLRGGR